LITQIIFTRQDPPDISIMDWPEEVLGYREITRWKWEQGYRVLIVDQYGEHDYKPIDTMV